jgi:hypothetical protein
MAVKMKKMQPLRRMDSAMIVHNAAAAIADHVETIVNHARLVIALLIMLLLHARHPLRQVKALRLLQWLMSHASMNHVIAMTAHNVAAIRETTVITVAHVATIIVIAARASLLLLQRICLRRSQGIRSSIA